MRAFVFPGQGSQYVGMGKDLYDKHAVVRELYDMAEEITGIPVKRLSFEGPEDDLRRTENTQVCIFVHSVALMRTLDIHPDLVFGHSLGELTAVYSAGVWDLKTALKLIALRGSLMSKAEEGGMLAVIGDNALELAERIARGFEDLVVANYNSPSQVILSGSTRSISEARKLLKGKCRVIPLKVGGAFHSPLMEEASEEFSKALEGVDFREADVPVILSNHTEPTTSPEVIKKALKLQLRSPVRFVDMVRSALSAGVDEFYEVGPKNVLCKLISQIKPGIRCVSLD